MHSIQCVFHDVLLDSLLNGDEEGHKLNGLCSVGSHLLPQGIWE